MPQTDSDHDLHDEQSPAAETGVGGATNGGPDAKMFGEAGPRNVKAGLQMQQELFEIFQEIGREWLARASSEAELAFNLPYKLSSTRSMPDALSAYQEWLREWMHMMDEDGRRFLADSQRIVGASTRYFTAATPAITS